MKDTQSSKSPSVVTKQRVALALKNLNYDYYVNDNYHDFEFCTLWGKYVIFVSLDPHSPLYCRAVWYRNANINHAHVFKDMCHHINSSNTEVKVYTVVNDVGVTKFVAETLVHIEMGLTDRQLESFIESSIYRFHEVFDFVEDTFPDPIEKE